MDNSDYGIKGYKIAEIPEIIPQITALRTEIYDAFDVISKLSGNDGVSNDKDVIHFRNTDQLHQFLAVKHLWNAPALFAIGGNPIFSSLLKSLGFKRPILELQPLLRCDMPIQKQSIFEKHQDYSYNIGSSNSVTIWIPLQDTGISEGALLVAPGTHINGVYPNNRGIITDEFKFNFEHCPVNLGQALIFNQKLVHQSGFNISEKIRFSVQLRFSDLGCIEYAKRGFPINHKTTTESYAGDLQIA